MFAANPNYASGKIKIGIIITKSFSGSGPIATISFATHKGAGTVTVNSGFIDSSGASVTGGGSSTTIESITNTTTTTGTTVTQTTHTSQVPQAAPILPLSSAP
jgi:hypothetical protein